MDAVGGWCVRSSDFQPQIFFVPLVPRLPQQGIRFCVCLTFSVSSMPTHTRSRAKSLVCRVVH